MGLKNARCVRNGRKGGKAAQILAQAGALSLGIVSTVTGRWDGMGMNVAGGKAEVQVQALEYDITAAEVVEAARGTIAYFSEVRAEGLGIVSKVTGRGDGMDMNVAGGKAEVQAQALEYDITAAEVVETARGTIAYFREVRAEGLDIVSKVTGRGDGMGMNVAGGKAEVQAQAQEYGITAARLSR